MNSHIFDRPIMITRSEFTDIGVQVIKEVCGEPDPQGDEFQAVRAMLCGIVLSKLEHKIFDTHTQATYMEATETGGEVN